MRLESLWDLQAQFPDIDGLWDRNDLLETERKIRLAIPENPVLPKDLELLTQLARVQALLGNLSQARLTIELAKKSVDLLELPFRLRPEIRCLLEQGRILCLLRQPIKAQSFFSQAWELSAQLKQDYFSIDAALMLSVCQPPKFQNEWLQKALGLAKKSQDAEGRLWLSQLFMMDGWHNFDFRRYDLAYESFKEALNQPRTSGDESKNILMRWCLARSLRSLNRIAEALEIQQSLLAELSQVGAKNGHVYLEIAECLQLQQNHKDAQTYFELAYKELSTSGWYSDNKATELVRIQFLSKKH